MREGNRADQLMTARQAIQQFCFQPKSDLLRPDAAEKIHSARRDGASPM